MIEKKERIAILPGSYDPITRGHVELIRRASKLFDRVVVAVMQNSEKRYLFSEKVRVQLAEASLQDIPNVSVIFDDGLLVDLYSRLCACCVVKGIRNEFDYRYEREQEEWNRTHLAGFQTVYLSAEKTFAEISSTEVRRRILNGLDLSDVLMPEAVALLQAHDFYESF